MKVSDVLKLGTLRAFLDVYLKRTKKSSKKLFSLVTIFQLLTTVLLGFIPVLQATQEDVIRARILVDLFHFNDYSYAFNIPVTSIIENNNYKISYLLESIKNTDLKNFDILALTGPFYPNLLNYTQDEIEAILKFVYEGGGLLLIFHTGASLDCVGKLFGMTQSNNFVWDPTGFNNITRGHPTTLDIETVKQGVYGGGTLNVTSPAKGLIFGDNDTEIAWVIGGVTQHYRREPGLPLLAVAQYGSGRVLGVSLLIWDANNPKLIINVLNWLVGKPKEVLESPPKLIFEAVHIESSHFAIEAPRDYINLIEPMLPYLDKSYELLRNFTSFIPYDGEKIEIIYDPTIARTGGLAGNPIVIQRPYPWPLERRLQVYFHEISHDFTGEILEELHSFEGDKLMLGEVFAWLCTLYINEQLGFQETALDLKNTGITRLGKYRNDFTSLVNEPFPPALLGMFVMLKEEQGWDLYRNFFKLIQEKVLPPPRNLTEQSTYLIYYLNASSKKDLTARFVEWGFPFYIPKPAKFKVSDLLIEPTDVQTNETVTVSLRITNVGEVKGIYILRILVNGTVESTKNVTLTGRDFTIITFELARNAPGVYEVEVDGLTGWFRVKALPKPAEFTVSELRVSLTKVRVGEEASISVKVTNTGEQTGSYTVELKVLGVIVDSRTVTLRGGESTIITFLWKGKEPGIYDIEVAGLKGTIEVVSLPPPITEKFPPPKDLDNDDLYEDLDGNGRLDFNDVVLFFSHFEESAVFKYFNFYDFNKNGRLDFDDIVKLFKRI